MEDVAVMAEGVREPKMVTSPAICALLDSERFSPANEVKEP